MPQRQVSPERKAIFYIGGAVAVLGFVCFLSVFFTFIANFGDFTDFEGQVRSMAKRALVGVVMIGVGKWMAGIGRMGLAGSGVKLDPEEARRDVEPWSRMTGGVVKDMLDETGIKLGSPAPDEELTFDEKLRRLQKLRDDRLISEQDFESTKKRILESA